MSQPASASTSDGGSRARDVDLEPLLEWVDLAPDCVGADRVEGVLLGLAQVAAQVVDGAQAASLTLVGADGKLSTAEATGALAKHMDTLQYHAAQGPCVEAANATQWTKILVTDLADQTRWPALAGQNTTGQDTTGQDTTGQGTTGQGTTGEDTTSQGAGGEGAGGEGAGGEGAGGQGAAVGARSVLSVSLFENPREGAGGPQQAVGSLNLYATGAGVFGDAQRDTALLLALYAALALAATAALGDAGARIERLKTAMATQTVIGQAQGILMERHKLTAGQAFDRLRTASMNLNRKLRDVAKDLSETGEDTALTPRRAVSGGEAARMKELARYDILDTPPDGAFDRVAAIAAKLFGVPMATVSIVDSDRVWFKASQGLAGVRQVTRDPGLCASVITQGKPYVVANTRTDPRTTAHPLVTGDLGLQFYAAAPITTSDGHHLGTVAVMDTQPHQPTPQQVEMLTDLAALVMDDLELRLSAINALRDRSPARFQP